MRLQILYSILDRWLFYCYDFSIIDKKGVVDGVELYKMHPSLAHIYYLHYLDGKMNAYGQYGYGTSGFIESWYLVVAHVMQRTVLFCHALTVNLSQEIE
jgi:hypothetical protein